MPVVTSSTIGKETILDLIDSHGGSSLNFEKYAEVTSSDIVNETDTILINHIDTIKRIPLSRFMNEVADDIEADPRFQLAKTSFNSISNPKTTDDLDEGSTNLYYTDDRFDARLSTKTDIVRDTDITDIVRTGDILDVVRTGNISLTLSGFSVAAPANAPPEYATKKKRAIFGLPKGPSFSASHKGCAASSMARDISIVASLL